MTIRELMLIVLAIAVAIASLISGGILASVLISMSALASVCIAIVAFVGQRSARISSIGFLIPVIAYGSAVYAAGHSEIQLSKGVLPTTQVLWPVYKSIVRVNYADPLTGKALANDDVRVVQQQSGSFGVMGVGMGGVMAHESPERESFALVAHVFIAMLFGYAGSKFAIWASRPGRNGTDEPSHEPKSPS